jgi:hypothetical protein
LFGRSATKLVTGLKEKRPNTTISVNPEKPRKGWFRVSVNGKDVVCLKDMPRPFKLLRELSLDSVVADVLAAL